MSAMSGRIAVLAVAAVLTSGVGRYASAQDLSLEEAEVPERAGKVLHALRIAGPAPRIDGRLDDAAWAAAEVIDDFVQSEPDNLDPATERTTVQVAYDDRAIYVAVYCYETDASQIAAGLGRRDAFPPSDLVYVSFDPQHDHRTGYTFGTNPSAVQSDVLLFDDTLTSLDYDGVWDVQTSVTAEGWIAEFEIPLSQMRFTLPSGNEAVWGFQVRRDIRRRGETARWVASPRGTRGFVSRFGHLLFTNHPAPPRRIELLPFTLGRLQTDPGGAPTKHGVDAGLDLRVGLGTSATLSATVNPDFGQVEQDPAVLNLSVFESRFAERRAFFLEDSRTLIPPYSQFPDFYSPRIGARPGRLPLQSGDHLVSRPDRTTILGAAKITGKTAGWTYGGLGALTAREYAVVERTVQAPDGFAHVLTADRLIEPLTFYSVGRLQRDMRNGTSNIGLTSTAVVREQDRDAFTGGIDGEVRWDDNRYSLNGHWVVTQAPIAGATRAGHGGASNFNFGSKHVSVYAHADHFSPSFRNADLGFLNSRVNKTNVNGGLTLIQPDRWGVSRRTSWNLWWSDSWNDEELNIGREVGTGLNVQFVNFWSAYTNTGFELEHFDDLDTRGGPPILVPSRWYLNGGVNTDSRKSWSVSLSGSVAEDDAGGWSASTSVNARVQPSGRLQASAAASYNRGEDAAQWVTNADVNQDGETDHVYGRLRRDVINVTLRATYAFSRDLTVEAFAQPFVAVGDYDDIRRLARPRSFDFEPASIGFNPDFNLKSVRSNVVLRWEYVPGSRLFIVWQRTAADGSRAGVFSPWRDLRDAVTGRGANVVIVKISYWIG